MYYPFFKIWACSILLSYSAASSTDITVKGEEVFLIPSGCLSHSAETIQSSQPSSSPFLWLLVALDLPSHVLASPSVVDIVELGGGELVCPFAVFIFEASSWSILLCLQAYRQGLVWPRHVWIITELKANWWESPASLTNCSLQEMKESIKYHIALRTRTRTPDGAFNIVSNLVLLEFYVWKSFISLCLSHISRAAAVDRGFQRLVLAVEDISKKSFANLDTGQRKLFRPAW
ncbi:hypothetical protein ElyMa_002848200 [Elysia marginata]|uniref:Uncharacterized protein n=1 Tax=Elysia marginata TaxID=1093978 RepID=A0AAV4HVT9_9GAST|nr:hypothetical protein ElyMa_002848200 [Elysia marginata]